MVLKMEDVFDRTKWKKDIHDGDIKVTVTQDEMKVTQY